MQFLGSRMSTTLFAMSLGAAALGCQAGALPDCDTDEECKMMYVKSAGGKGGAGGMAPAEGMGGMTPAGMGGKPAGMGGSRSPDMGGGGGVTLTASTPVKNCAAYPTLGEMDKLFVKSCGVDTFCHLAKIPYGDLKTGDIWNRMKDIKPALACADGKMVDSQNVANSILLVKIKQAVPACPPMAGKDPGTIMPPLMKDQIASKTKVMPLTPAEIACFEGFANAVAGK